MHSITETIEVFDSSQKNFWEERFHMLPPDLQDINYSYDYQFLFEKNGDGTIQLFVYREKDSMYYYPFLIRPVVSPVLDAGHQDIENVYGYTGPLYSTREPGFPERANEAFTSWCKEQKVVCEFIRFHPLLHNAEQVLKDSGISVVPLRDYVVVDLNQSVHNIESNYTSQNRNKIRKAEKNGVQCQIDSDGKYFNDFVEIYLENMKALHAARMYYFSTAFFNQLKVLVQKNGCLVLAQKDGKTIGASIFLAGGKIGHYFLSSATEEGKKLAVSNLMLHHGIVWGKENGMTKMHLGGGLTADAQDPLLVFKKNFSALTEKFYIGKRIFDKESYEMLIQDWDRRFPDEAPKYKSILQRYRWNKEDLL